MVSFRVVSGALFVLVSCLLLGRASSEGFRGFSLAEFEENDVFILPSASITGDKTVRLCYNIGNCKGVMWYPIPVSVRGFRTSFTFMITNTSQNGTQGMSFVIQNDPNKLYASGPLNMGLGYGSFPAASGGIAQSIAIEFDTFMNPELADPNNNHIGVHTNGLGQNNAHESFTIGQPATSMRQFWDSTPHRITITYDPSQGTIKGLLDGYSDYSLNVQSDELMDLVKLIGVNDTDGTAYIGFTAAGGTTGGEQFFIYDWTYTFLGTINTANSIFFDITPATAGQTHSFFLQSVDQYQNNMTMYSEGLSATLTLTNATTVAATVTYRNMGLYEISYQSTLAGPVTINVSVNGTLIGAAPIASSIVPAIYSPANTYAYGNMSGTAMAGVTRTVFVQLVDAYMNTITVDQSPDLNITITAQDGSSSGVEVVTYIGEGIYSVEYTLTVTGDYDLFIHINDSPISNPSHSVSVIPAAIYPPYSYVSDTPDGDVTAGEPGTMYLHTLDYYMNHIDYYQQAEIVAQFTYTEANDSTLVVDGVPSYVGNGTWAISYELTKAVSYDLVISLNGSPIQNPDHTVSVVPAAIFPEGSLFDGPGLQGSTAGVLGEFEIQLQDSYGNNITSSGAEVYVTLVDTNEVVTVSAEVTDLGQGLYLVQYNATYAAEYRYNVTIESVFVPDHLAVIVPNVVFPGACSANGTDLVSGVAGDIESFHVILRDQFYNLLWKPEDPSIIDVTFATPTGQSTYLDIKCGEQETYLCTVDYNITVSGKYDVDVTVHGEPIDTPTFSLELVPASLDPYNSLAQGRGLSSATSDIPVTFTLQLRDIWSNNLLDNIGAELSVTMVLEEDPSVVVVPTITPAGSQYEITYMATVAGNYTLSVEVNDVPVMGSPFSPVVSPSFVSPPNCIAEFPALETSPAGENVTIIIHIRDAQNNTIPEPELPENAIVATFQNNDTYIDNIVWDVQFIHDGLFSLTYNATKAEPLLVSITLSGTPLIGSPSLITTIPAATFSPRSYALGPGVSAAYVQTPTDFTVYAVDLYGNQRTIGGDQIVVTLFAQGEKVTATVIDGNNGTYNVQYQVKLRAEYSMQVVMNNVNVQGSPFTLNTQYAQQPTPVVLIVGIVFGSVAILAIAGFFIYRRIKSRAGYDVLK
eukprot:TRINITY_DN1178_c0_g1_i1.p1 TRINITY_DN1178_c0_g1~~TRINITY_DN1178_c0_g1_i1.p1  ORF type:complete len:1144 (+),score=354.68 TRINITY_DN1178_c0_g1_i1:38-3469(+)